MARTTADNDANLYELEGYGTTITYSTSSITGQPLFSYKDVTREVNLSGNNDIQVDGTEIGNLVTVQIDVVPDLHTLTFSVLIPRFNLPEDNESPFETEAVLTEHLTTIGGPDLVAGQLKNYSTVSLSGRARRVVF